MIRRSALIASAIAVLAIAGCSGNDNDSPPTSTPTPTPAPSSSATPTYGLFPLTAATQLFSVTASTSYTGDPAAGPVTLGTAATDSYSNRVSFALQNIQPATDALPVVVREGPEESRFGTGDLLTAPAAGVTEYVYRDSAPAAPVTFAQLELLNNAITGSVTSDAALALTRSSYAAWWRTNLANVTRLTYASIGYPTLTADMPTTGTISYTVRVTGRSVVSPATGASTIARLTGTASVSINYPTGLVTLTLALPGYGDFTGTGAIAAGNNQFTGSFGPGSTAGGTFQGIAYGPQAAEIGITFAITQSGASSSRAVGVVIGKKS